MNYGMSAIRLDMGKEARIRTAQFFDLTGKRSETELVSSARKPESVDDSFPEQIYSINWLLKDRRYHHGEVDLQVRRFLMSDFTICFGFLFAGTEDRRFTLSIPLVRTDVTRIFY
jgi:hypothetical protein